MMDIYCMIFGGFADVTYLNLSLFLSYATMFPDAQFYEDYDKMLSEANLDVVIVETGADIHAEFCIKALERNINVLSDIPTVASLTEADLLWKAAQKSACWMAVRSRSTA